MKRYLTLFVLLVIVKGVVAQEQVQGIVFDKDTRQRISKVYLYNIRTHRGAYNNLKGEFTFPAQKGDTLVAALQGYRVDTITVRSQSTLLFYLKRTSILLNEVKITDSLLSPAEQLAKNRKEYEDIYRKGNKSDLLTIGGSNGTGAGLSIDALWSLFSREGKNARFLQQILERDYREAMIDFRFTKAMVTASTGLTEPDLADFMQQYRPSYYFIVSANDYSLINFVRTSYQAYLKNPKAYHLPRLVPGKPE